MDLRDGLGTEAVLFEILKRLPVKSLLRFMCISEPWNHLINDPFFITHHLQFNKSSSSSSVLGIPFSRDYHGKEHVQQLEYFRIDHIHKTTLEHLEIPFLWRLKPDPKPEPRRSKPRISILAHCNGLVLAFDSQTIVVDEWTRENPNPYKAKSKAFYVDRYIICNPIARRFVILPESTIEVPDLYFEFNLERFRYKKLNATGFGFIDDLVYKVVRVTYGMGELTYHDIESYRPYEPPWVEAYDSRSDSWRRVPISSGFSYEYLNDGVYNSFDGCLYWFGRGHGNRERYSTLVWFHLVDETWHETLLPYKYRFDEDREDGVFGECGLCRSVGILGESVVMFVGDTRTKLVCSVWKMNKEEDKVSWTHIYRFNFGGSPIGFIRNDELFLMMDLGKETNWRKLVLHDSKKMNDACFGFTDLDFKVGNIVPDFVESLVLLDGESGFIEDIPEETYYFPEEPRKRVWEEDEDLGDLTSMFDDNS